jgi:hypothetical protein
MVRAILRHVIVLLLAIPAASPVVAQDYPARPVRLVIGASWKDVARMCCFLHRDESLPQLRERFKSAVDARMPAVDYTFVDSRQAKRLEIELTARIGRSS